MIYFYFLSLNNFMRIYVDKSWKEHLSINTAFNPFLILEAIRLLIQFWNLQITCINFALIEIQTTGWHFMKIITLAFTLPRIVFKAKSSTSNDRLTGKRLTTFLNKTATKKSKPRRYDAVTLLGLTASFTVGFMQWWAKLQLLLYLVPPVITVFSN